MRTKSRNKFWADLLVPITILNHFHRAHFENNDKITRVKRYGCYYCGKVYSRDKYPIEQWVDDGQTAVCPKCGVNAVIPEIYDMNLTNRQMGQLKEQIFGKK